MPINPAIALQTQVPQQRSILDKAQQLFTLKDMQTRGKFNEAQLAGLQQGQRDQANVRGILADTDDDDERISRLTEKGYLGAAEQLQKMSREQLEASKLSLENDSALFQEAQTRLRPVFAEQDPERQEQIYQSVLGRFQREGHPAAKYLPSQFDPGLVGQFKDIEFSLDVALQEADLELKERDLNAPDKVPAGQSLARRQEDGSYETVYTAPETTAQRGGDEIVRGSSPFANHYRLLEAERTESTGRPLSSTDRAEITEQAMKKAADQSAASAGLISVYVPELGMNVLQPRSAGLQLPRAPTAKMQEMAEARGQMASKITTLQSLSNRIITKVGPAQRADAIARGAEAVYGTDPEFRSYMDLKDAMGMQLAVSNQGAAQLSDRDVEIWSKLVPDPYRDTAESSDIKWAMLRSMGSLPIRADLLKTDAADALVRDLLEANGLDPETGFPAESGGSASGEQTAVNPQTGEIMVFRNGQWVKQQ